MTEKKTNDIAIAKTGENSIEVTFPKGTNITDGEITASDLYSVLTKNLHAAPLLLKGCLIEW